MERSPLPIRRCEIDIEVLVQGNAAVLCGTRVPQVAGRLGVGPRPTDRRCRSGSPGRGRERPAPSVCPVRHRGDSACAGPCRPPRRVAPVPTIPPEGGFADEELDGRRHRGRHRNGGRARARTAVPRPRRQPLSRPDRLQRSGHPRRHPPLVLRRARRRGHTRGLARPLGLAGLVAAPLQVPAQRGSCPSGPPRRTTTRPRS